MSESLKIVDGDILRSEEFVKRWVMKPNSVRKQIRLEESDRIREIKDSDHKKNQVEF